VTVTVSESLLQLEVLVIDCQATSAAPRGHLLELGWARIGPMTARADARLIVLPDGAHIPATVTRLTGISEQMASGGVDAPTAWRELSNEAATLAPQPAPTVIHFARFEQPFLHRLAGGTPPLDVVCTHDIARRLFPGLPRCSLRALSGYFGRGVGSLRRSADHVDATAFVWRELVRLLHEQGVCTWSALQHWLTASPARAQRRPRLWPMPRTVRLSLPDAPGIYRMLRSSGDVLYVGKAASLRHRVNSYFRKQKGVQERTLEMLSQARELSFQVMPSALEAALLEPDEIKQYRPPYNVAFTVENRSLWFASPHLDERSAYRSSQCPLGPFASADMLEQVAALAVPDGRALGAGRWRPDPMTFEAGYARLAARHPELSRQGLGSPERWLRLGTRLWREGRRERDGDEDNATQASRASTVWTPELVHVSLEWLALRAALARRRAIWLTRLFDCSVVWREPGDTRARLLVIEAGEVAVAASVAVNTPPPIPTGHLRTCAQRRGSFTLASFDRLRVLTTELKRLVAAGAPVALRLGAGPALVDARLASALWWV
jgi:DNA polymerase-3 subunit epsilon